MNWISALKEYNKGHGSWCIPRKGTAEYNKVRELMKPKTPLKQLKPTPNDNDVFFEYLKQESAPTIQAAVRRKLAKK